MDNLAETIMMQPNLQDKELPQHQLNYGNSPPLTDKKLSNSIKSRKKCRKRALHNTKVNGEDNNDESVTNVSTQLVLYNPHASNTAQDVIPIPNHNDSYALALHKKMVSNSASRVLPTVGAFTIQCVKCYKWRLIPTKEKYEQIREHILENPFMCEQARAWRQDIQCDDPTDVVQDGSKLWAIDKPNIPRPPPGWERELRIRGEGSSQFADIYYIAPSGKRMRSMIEVERYLLEHPEYAEQGVKISQFSFQTPKPLQENYVRRRSSKVANPTDGSSELPRPLELEEVNPPSWVEPTYGDIQKGHAFQTAPYEPSLPSRRKKMKSYNPNIYNTDISNPTRINPVLQPTIIEKL